jgi:hypothetical protein
MAVKSLFALMIFGFALMASGGCDSSPKVENKTAPPVPDNMKGKKTDTKKLDLNPS